VDDRGLYKATRLGASVTRLLTNVDAQELLALDGVYALVHAFALERAAL
jgi:hypothetical protein